MKGGTLMVSREVKNHDYYKAELEKMGFTNVTVTALEKDALESLIREMKPTLLMMGARFYQSCTPFLMGELKRTFPKIKMAALVVGEYPAELAMYFILNGISSYVTSFVGIDLWYKGLDELSKGREFVSPDVLERIDLRRDYPMPAGKLTQRHKEVIRLICNGWKDSEIADTLRISRCTVARHKSDILTTLNARSVLELVHIALKLGIIALEELCFHHRDFILNPLPEEKILKRGKSKNQRPC